MSSFWDGLLSLWLLKRFLGIDATHPDKPCLGDVQDHIASLTQIPVAVQPAYDIQHSGTPRPNHTILVALTAQQRCDRVGLLIWRRSPNFVDNSSFRGYGYTKCFRTLVGKCIMTNFCVH
jgi:hypothetical protein